MVGLRVLTTVWTIWGLCIRKLFTVWKTSSRPSALTRSKILLSAMNVPVRPAPALQQRTKTVHLFVQMQSRCWVLTATGCLPAVYDYGMVPRLLLLSLHWGDDVDHAFPFRRDANLWPAVEVEVPDRPRLLLLWEEMQRLVRNCNPSEIWFISSWWKIMTDVMSVLVMCRQECSTEPMKKDVGRS